MSARLLLVRVVLRPLAGGAGRGAEAAERDMSVGMDVVGVVLSAKRPAMILSVIHDVARQRAARKAARVPVMLTA
jgi:hypothetical protein